MSWPVLYETPVLREWIDYNGHMNLAYYVLVFDRGTDGLLDRLGIGERYRAATGRTIFVVEAHLTYASEAKEGEPLAVETLLVDADEKRLHVFHRMLRGRGGSLVATNELLCLHVDQAGPKAAPFDVAARERIDAMLAEQRREALPPELGRAIALRRAR